MKEKNKTPRPPTLSRQLTGSKLVDIDATVKQEGLVAGYKKYRDYQKNIEPDCSPQNFAKNLHNHRMGMKHSHAQQGLLLFRQATSSVNSQPTCGKELLNKI